MYRQSEIDPGHVYNGLTIIREVERKISPSGQSKRMFLCKCECGNTKVIMLMRLVSGHTKSCGCLQGEHHNMSRTGIYKVWKQMNERCHRKNASPKQKRNYQAKGITVCEVWRESFSTFYQWAIKSGYKKGLQIDRIDNSQGYYPDNCRFVTCMVNANNRDITIRVMVDNVSLSVTDLLIKFGIDHRFQVTIGKRIKRGWPYLEAIKPPFTGRQRKRSIYIKSQAA